MKKTLILAAGFAMMACGAVAQETSVPKRITIIEGKFFRNLPEEVAKMMTPDGIKFFYVIHSEWDKGRRDKDAGAFDQRGAT